MLTSKIYFRILLAVLAIGVSTVVASANDWQSSSGEIEFLVTHISTPLNGNSKDTVRVLIKNTSPVEKGLIATSQDELRGIRLYFIDNAGTKHLLHDHVYHAKAPFPGETPQEEMQERLKEEISLAGSATIIPIQSGEIRTLDVSLTTEDISLIKSQLIQCEFSIIDKNTSHEYVVKSTPAALVDLTDTSTKK